MMNATMPDIDLNGTELNDSQRRELEALIQSFEIYLCRLRNPSVGHLLSSTPSEWKAPLLGNRYDAFLLLHKTLCEQKSRKC